MANIDVQISGDFKVRFSGIQFSIDEKKWNELLDDDQLMEDFVNEHLFDEIMNLGRSEVEVDGYHVLSGDEGE